MSVRLVIRRGTPAGIILVMQLPEVPEGFLLLPERRSVHQPACLLSPAKASIPCTQRYCRVRAFVRTDGGTLVYTRYQVPFCCFLNDRVSTPGFSSESPQLLLHHAEKLHLSDQQQKRSITRSCGEQVKACVTCLALPCLALPCLAWPCPASPFALPCYIPGTYDVWVEGQ